MPKRAIQAVLAVLLAVALLGDPAWAAGGAKKKDSGHGGGAAVVEVPRFIELDVLVAPIISSRRVRGQMELSLVLEVKNEELGPEVMRKLPRLEASFVSVAANYAASLGLPTKRLDLALVMKGLQNEADRIFPPGTIAVLIQQAQYRR
jgi:flagellar basal body-associated protein FliL